MSKVDDAEWTFLHTEVDTGLTFCRLALSATDNARRERNRVNALKAYNSLVRFSKRAALTPSRAQTLQNGIAELKRLLDRLSDREKQSPLRRAKKKATRRKRQKAQGWRASQ